MIPYLVHCIQLDELNTLYLVEETPILSRAGAPTASFAREASNTCVSRAKVRVRLIKALETPVTEGGHRCQRAGQRIRTDVR